LKLKLHIVSDDDQLIAFAKFKDAQGAIASGSLLVFHSSGDSPPPPTNLVHGTQDTTLFGSGHFGVWTKDTPFLLKTLNILCVCVYD
jgi:hypothetical protein